MKDAKGINHTWNNRVMLHEGADGGEDMYAIHEVHYADDMLDAYTLDPVGVTGGSIDDLRVTLERMLRAIETPILRPEDFPKCSRTRDEGKGPR